MTQQHTGGAEFWDERYREQDRLFSGNPNGVLVTDTADLPPGQALDVGCGEGGDAVWLARHGWHVTAIDISRVALERAAEAAHTHGVDGRVSWVHGDPTTMPPPAGAFDLVSVHYLPMRLDAGPAAVRGLLDAVAPGGTLLFVGHDPSGVDESHDVYAYYQPEHVADLLDDDWTVECHETRARTTAPPEGTHHTHDVVLHAHRRP
ncbi:Methyltransferase domain-containing protein [Prauserella aidingensis]|uniref:class I SAM-dependent methyltransferase n=1 Tax=Prauserella aidingensis TaxID=387890 RepID=UPI0020A46F14|nr:class I SAM-dependent methyltransferase [Prauserella aidingensis]MCP2255155.1 Methyltransferase domain-containing protein [Prauserella aidingensis]